MENDKDMFKFFIEFIFLDHLEVGVDVNFNVHRKHNINRFLKTIPSSRILTTISLLGDVILKLHDKSQNEYKFICMMFVRTLCICYHLKNLLMKIQLMETNKNLYVSWTVF